jgi:RND family efflux transporter MFP subunit
MRFPSCGAVLSLALVLTGCGDSPAPPEYVPRVKVQAVQLQDHAVSASLTGDVQARVQTQMSFRVGGQISERLVDVGDRVKPGQVLARLDRQDQLNNLRSAEAAASAERARLKQADADLWRQQQLLPKGYTSRSEYDAALAAQRGAKNSLAAVEAQLSDAREQLGYTDLKADAAGVITSRQAEVGQVVQASAPVLGLARDGDRDAVFNVYESLLAIPPGQPIDVVLLDDPSILARGEVREVTPTVSAETGTVQVKIALIDPPPQMTLGATVSASVRYQATPSVEVPWAALTKSGKKPAVWVIGENEKADLRVVQVGRYLTGKVLIAGGLEDGDRVVVAGGQLMHPDQTVEIAEEEEAAQ